MSGLRGAYWESAPGAARALVGVSREAAGGGVEPGIAHMAALRTSQLNGCGYCVDLHYRDGLAAGVDPRHLNAVAAWRETPFFSPRQRAALAWSEALHQPGAGGVSDEAFEGAAGAFDAEELAHLTFTIVATHAWNRLSVGYGRGVDPEE